MELKYFVQTYPQKESSKKFSVVIQSAIRYLSIYSKLQYNAVYCYILKRSVVY